MWIETGNSSAVLQSTATCISQSVSAPLPGNTSAKDSGSTSTAEPSTSSSSDESAGEEDTPRTVLKRKLAPLKLPAKKARVGRPTKKKALDHHNFIPKCFAEKLANEQAKSNFF